MSEGTRVKTAEEILRDETAAFEKELECLKAELRDLESEIKAKSFIITEVENIIREKGVEIAFLKGKVEAYESIFAKHNLSLYATE